MYATIVPVADAAAEPAVRGFLHVPETRTGDGLVLTHGAGGNCGSKLLVSLAEAFAAAGMAVMRCDLPFRQARLTGPPFPGSAARDREGLHRALDVLRAQSSGRLFVGGHSYGGRQASMLLAEQPALAEGLLLLSYPLHPPRKSQQLRTAHLPQLTRPVLFVHGSRDGFGSFEEMENALAAIPGPTRMLKVAAAGHELITRRNEDALSKQIVKEFLDFVGTSAPKVSRSGSG